LDVEHVHVPPPPDRVEVGAVAELGNLDRQTLIQIRYLTHPLLEH
jgi:hypothetical protein